MEPRTPIRGIAVSDLLRKADPIQALKISVVFGPDPLRDEHALWSVSQVVRGLKQYRKDAEVAQLYLPTYTLVPGAVSDPNHERFSADDQMPAIWHALKDSHIVLVGARECCGFVDYQNVLLLEKLHLIAEQQEHNGRSEKLFRCGVIGTVVIGGIHAMQAAMTLTCAWNKYGLTVPAHGVAAWDHHRGPVHKAEKFVRTLDRLAQDLISTAQAVCEE